MMTRMLIIGIMILKFVANNSIFLCKTQSNIFKKLKEKEIKSEYLYT